MTSSAPSATRTVSKVSASPARDAPGAVRALRRAVSTAVGLARLAWWRIRFYSGLSLLSLSGIVLAVGLVTSAAFFAQAVDQVMLDRELAEYSRITQRPPFNARIFAPSTRTVPLTLERAEVLGGHVAETLATEVGLPVTRVILTADSGALRLTPVAGDTRYQSDRPLASIGLVYMAGIADEIRISDGAPLDETSASQNALDVWLHHDLAEELGVQVGDRFAIPTEDGIEPLSVVAAGFWQPLDPASSFWSNDPNQTMRDKLLVRRGDYLGWVEPRLTPKVRTAAWQIILDESRALPARARDYKTGFERAAAIIPKYLPDGRVTAPTLSLEKFVGQQTTLTTLLLGFNVPALGFLLYFLVLTSAVIAYWQRRETSLLRSRGISRASILNFTFIESCILILVGGPLGLLVGIGLARLMGYTVSFLTFEERPPLPVSLYGVNVPLTVATLGVVLVAKLWTVRSTSQETVVTQAREHSRPTHAPFWYRNYLDIILIVVTVYGYRQFLNRGWLGSLVRDRPGDLYQDPLIVLVPGLFIIALALVAMRVFPLLMRLLDLVARWLPIFSVYLALRQLGRQSQTYINPLLLVIISLALGVYTLSMAASMDQWLSDRVYYRVGTDLTVLPFLETEAMATSPSAGADWIPPIDEFTLLPGVEHAARVGAYLTSMTLPGSAPTGIDGRFLALDRIDFSLTAWYRDDFARESLGGLMNRLAATSDGILVSQRFLEQHTLRIGDRIDILVIPEAGLSTRDLFTIVGTFEHFPTVYDDVTVVGNLEHIESYFGVTMPHRIWFRLAPGATAAEVRAAIPITGIDAVEARDAVADLNSEQAQLQRIGVFGTLSVSFLAAAFMAALGLLTYSYASLHERLYQFSVLRAVGLHRREVVGQVALEYVVLTAFGAVAGVICGMIAARLFVPLFRVASGPNPPLPPLIPILAQAEVIPLALAFAGTMILLEVLIISSAFFRRLFEALRLGHHG
jgi:putative ABC transport system permease protein